MEKEEEKSVKKHKEHHKGVNHLELYFLVNYLFKKVLNINALNETNKLVFKNGVAEICINEQSASCENHKRL